MSNMLENQVKALVARHFGISPSKVRPSSTSSARANDALIGMLLFRH